MDVRKTIENMVRTLKVAKKPKVEDLISSLKVTLLGFALVGSIGFLIKFIAYIIQSYF